ncbi:MAG: putative zinc-binding protein [Candidatus Helarchaeota archaeon]
MSNEKVYILPCSGIGKVFGSIGREAAYIVVDELAKDKAKLECLPLVVKGKKEIIETLKANKIIVIDGCPMRCSYNDVTDAVGKVDAPFMSTDLVKERRDLKPEKQIIPMGENAKKLSRILAERIASKVNELLDENRGGDE